MDKCLHCGKLIQQTDEISTKYYVTFDLRESDRPAFPPLCVLNFHMSCFQEIAGPEYINKFIDKINKREGTEVELSR